MGNRGSTPTVRQHPNQNNPRPSINYNFNQSQTRPVAPNRSSSTIVTKDDCVFIYNGQNRTTSKSPPPVVEQIKKEIANTQYVDSTRVDLCPLCCCLMSVPIFMCESGHSVCSVCRSQMLVCALCRQPLTNIRNRSLEAIIQAKIDNRQVNTFSNQLNAVPIFNQLNTAPVLSCKNRALGCTFVDHTSSLNEHASECHYRVVACPRNGCVWGDRLSNILAHFKNNHRNKIKLNNRITINVDLSITATETQVFDAVHNDSIFIYNIHVDTESKTVSWVFQRYGSEARASHWIYNLQIIDARPKVKRSVTLSDIFQSSDIHLTDAIHSSCCSVLPISVVKSYLHNGGNLSIKIFIREKKENRANQ